MFSIKCYFFKWKSQKQRGGWAIYSRLLSQVFLLNIFLFRNVFSWKKIIFIFEVSLFYTYYWSLVNLFFNLFIWTIRVLVPKSFIHIFIFIFQYIYCCLTCIKLKMKIMDHVFVTLYETYFSYSVKFKIRKIISIIVVDYVSINPELFNPSVP